MASWHENPFDDTYGSWATYQVYGTTPATAEMGLQYFSVVLKADFSMNTPGPSDDLFRQIMEAAAAKAIELGCEVSPNSVVRIRETYATYS